MSRRFGSKKPSTSQQRVALQSLLAMREKPLSDADKVSLSRSYGLSVSEIEQVAASVARGRRQA